MTSTNKLTEEQREVADTCALIGFERSSMNGALFTRIENNIAVQMAYHFIKPIAKMRSVDGEDNDILAFVPTPEVVERLEEWYRHSESDEWATLTPPLDVRICEEGLEILLRVNGWTEEGEDEVHHEIQTPPLNQDGATLIAQEFGRHGLVVTNGVGRTPFVTCGEVDIDQYLTDV